MLGYEKKYVYYFCDCYKIACKHLYFQYLTNIMGVYPIFSKALYLVY